MLMVGVVEAVVEAELRGGSLLCPSCSGALAPWGHARVRWLRLRFGEPRALRPRRARCRGCRGTHVLLPDLCLLRRHYEVEVIGAVIEAKARGLGYVRIAGELGVPVETVRAWLRRFGCNAEAIRGHFTRWAHALDPELAPIVPAGDPFGEALEAIAVAVRAWVLRFGRRSAWRLAALLSGGLLLATRADLFRAMP
jgi:hypothetical protein